jgi:hypothetical protein
LKHLLLIVKFFIRWNFYKVFTCHIEKLNSIKLSTLQIDHTVISSILVYFFSR